MANHPQYTAIAADSGTAAAVDQRAVLGDPGNIVLSSAIRWAAQLCGWDADWRDSPLPLDAQTRAAVLPLINIGRWGKGSTAYWGNLHLTRFFRNAVGMLKTTRST